MLQEGVVQSYLRQMHLRSYLLCIAEQNLACDAGFIIQSIFNLLLILLSGSRTALNARYADDRDVGVATYPSKPRAAPTPTNTAPQVTVVSF